MASEAVSSYVREEFSLFGRCKAWEAMVTNGFERSFLPYLAQGCDFLYRADEVRFERLIAKMLRTILI